MSSYSEAYCTHGLRKEAHCGDCQAALWRRRAEEYARDSDRLEWLVTTDASLEQLTTGGWCVQGGSVRDGTYWETRIYQDWRRAIDAGQEMEAEQ